MQTLRSITRRFAQSLRTSSARVHLLVFGFCVGTVMLALLTLSPAATRFTRSALGDSSLLGAVNEHLNPFRTRHALLQCGLPVYDLQIEPAEYNKVLDMIEEAIRRGELTDDIKRWADARFVCDGESYAVKIRARGNGRTHWSGDRKSWRLRFAKDKPFGGQREVNLIIPANSKAIHQHFANAVYKRLGLITQRDGYCVLRINGVPQGVYYEVEHLDAPLLAYNKRPESTIFSNTLHGKGIESFKEQVTEDNSDAWRALQTLLDYEEAPTPQRLAEALAVTNVDDFLAFIAGNTLFCSDHNSMVTDNHKLYFDSSRGQFYRIPWDCAPERIPKLELYDFPDWRGAFDVYYRWPMSRLRIAVLRDRKLRLKRNRILWGLVADDSLLELFDERYAGLDLAFWSDVLGDSDAWARIQEYRSVVQYNMATIRRVLANNEMGLRIRAERPDVASLEFAVDNASGVEVQAIRLSRSAPNTRYTLIRDQNTNGMLDTDDVAVAQGAADPTGHLRFGDLSEEMLPDVGVTENLAAYLHFPGADGGEYKTKPLRHVVYPKVRTYRYFLHRVIRSESDPPRWPKVEAVAVNAVTGRRLGDHDLVIRRYDAMESYEPARRMAGRDEFLKAHSQFVAGASDGDVRLTAGTHRIEQTLVIPEGIALVVDPGAVVQFGPAASLVAFGPVRAEATPESPIRLEAASEQPWGSFAVVRPGAESVFRNVQVSGAAGATVDGIFFSGALAIHDGDAMLDGCRIVDCPAEDGVNIKNGKIRVVDTLFARNESDALDLDFVTGEVRHCRFVEQGGDGVDLSGSQVTVAGNRIERCGDKGISIGEQSQIEVGDNLIMGNGIGIAIKDLSTARIEHCTLIDNETGIAAYRKKPVFGGGSGTVIRCIIVGGRVPVRRDAFSVVDVHDCMMPPEFNVAGNTVAGSGLVDHLRSSNYVYDFAAAAQAGAASPDGAASAEAGIIHPPVELQ